MLAGIDLLIGEAIPFISDTHKSSDFIIFLKILDEKYPKEDKIRLILDNHSAHASKETYRILETMPGRFEFVFTPKHGSWLNLIEGFFSKMTRQMLKGIRVANKEELIMRIYKYFDEINESRSSTIGNITWIKSIWNSRLVWLINNRYTSPTRPPTSYAVRLLLCPASLHGHRPPG